MLIVLGDVVNKDLYRNFVEPIMQQLTVHIPDNKMAFFIELATSLGFKVDKGARTNILTKEQIDLVNVERKKIKDEPDNFIDWEEARKTFNLD